jgi:hypothetical protein
MSDHSRSAEDHTSMTPDPTPTAALTEKPKSASAQGLQILGTVVGLTIGYYAGMTLLIPAAFAMVIAFALFKVVPNRKPIILPAAIVGGHVLWMILGCVILGSWTAALPEIVILGGVVIWLIGRPRLIPIAVLAILELIEFCYSAYMFSLQSFGTDLYKARLVHSSLFLVAGASLVQAFIQKRKERNPPLQRATDDDGAAPHRV